MAPARQLFVDEAKIKKAVQSGIPLTITTYTLPHEVEIYIDQVITAFLKQVNRENLRNYVVYCVQELAVNAKKANTKRIYFMEKGLNLNDPVDYKIGMATFMDDTLNNLGHYLQLQKERGFYIKVILQVKNDSITMEVRNNATITKTELFRIHEKLKQARKYDNMEEALGQVLDDAEGAGLGLVILTLMLKKIGLNEDSFSIMSDEKETVAQVCIPMDQTLVKSIAELSATIVENVNSLPQFPENILTVQQLIGDPKADMISIAREISMDPTITADLLKVVNSAQYMLSKKVDNIAEAVKLVGLRGIKNLLYSYGTQKILGEDSPEKKALWEHSYKTAFYAFNIVRNFHVDPGIIDDAYVGGLLHDMGKIVFAHIHPDLLDRIHDFCDQKNLPAATFENIAAGMNHTEIGAMIAEKWNFPDSLINAIRYHHDPVSAPEKDRSLADTVYLANMFCEYERGDVNFDQFVPEVLERFGITTKNQIDSLLDLFAAGFRKENTR
ncbi:MAG: HDOD domain-containing protein [Treponema sp.]|jgi:putative nucleotidyltransferase with HDIG domain|nr:HDOD domain-containing protein [Treponema sp.]